MLNHILKDCEILCFNNAVDALHKIETFREKIDLIFTDLTMIGLSGDELAAEIREKNLKIPIIGVTGAEPTAELLRVFDKLLTKPVTIAALREIVHDFLENPN